uniref:Major facilitator superfamily (MFS) profile domain-containing protein n=1 Tax=Capitella teleta TaxID=283909 RepID=X1ZMR5_CAPTE
MHTFTCLAEVMRDRSASWMVFEHVSASVQGNLGCFLEYSNSGQLDRSQTGHGYEEAINATGYGKFHYLLLALCGWALSSDAIEILCISFVLPSATCELNLSDSDKGLLNSCMFLGMMFGGYLWGTLADFRGRRAVLLWSLALNAVGGLSSSFAQEFWLFALLRFVSGIGVGGSMPVIFSYYCEFQPKEKRGSMISLLATFWMCGNIAAAGLAWIVIPQHFGISTPTFSYDSWRVYLALCILPSATSAFIFVLMPESPRFLMQMGKEQEALRVFQRVYASNHGCSGDQYPAFSTTVELFQPPMRTITILMITIFFVLSYGYYGLFLWFPELFQRMALYGGTPCDIGETNGTIVIDKCAPVDDSVYFNGFLTALSNLPGNIFTLLVIDRIGRKPLLVSSMLISGLSVFFIYLLKTQRDSIIMSCIFGGVSVIGWNTLDVLSVELFPTHLRSTANGALSGLGRVAAILGNVTFGELVGAHCAVPMILVASLLSFGGLMALKLPNTTRQDLS